MRIDVVTLFPEFIAALLACGVTGRGAERGLFEVATWNPRDWTHDRHHTVDDRPYGGGPGMVRRRRTSNLRHAEWPAQGGRGGVTPPRFARYCLLS